MKKVFITCCLLFGIAGFSTAQEQATQAVYAELGGAGLAYSFNYDFRFDRGDIRSWGMRIGAGGWARNNTYNSEGLMTIPFQINRMLGKGRHFFEIGGGATFIYFRDKSTWNNTSTTYKNFHFILDSGETPAFMGTLNMGYRRMPEDGGFTFRANVTPLFNHTGFWPLFAGVSFGYAF